MSTIANALSAASPWSFLLVGIVILIGLAYGLYADHGSGITTRAPLRASPREQLDLFKRGTH